MTHLMRTWVMVLIAIPLALATYVPGLYYAVGGVIQHSVPRIIFGVLLLIVSGIIQFWTLAHTR